MVLSIVSSRVSRAGISRMSAKALSPSIKKIGTRAGPGKVKIKRTGKVVSESYARQLANSPAKMKAHVGAAKKSSKATAAQGGAAAKGQKRSALSVASDARALRRLQQPKSFDAMLNNIAGARGYTKERTAKLLKELFPKAKVSPNANKSEMIATMKRLRRQKGFRTIKPRSEGPKTTR